MRLVILSDSHGGYANFRKVILKHMDEAKAFLFLGDGSQEFNTAKIDFPDLEFHAVKGNNDIMFDQPLQRIVSYSNTNILMMHGHTAPIFYFTENIVESAKQNNCQIVLYGHTHVPVTDYCDGVHILNPGSIQYPRGGTKKSYGVIDITQTSIFITIMDVPSL